jgi:hypothetical protein
MLTVQLLRAAVSAVPLVALYYLAPLDGRLDVGTLIGFALGLLAFAVVIIWQVRAIVSSDVPRLHALQGVVVGVSTLLVVFAATYFVISNDEHGSFSEPLGRTDALYFTVTILHHRRTRRHRPAQRCRAHCHDDPDDARVDHGRACGEDRARRGAGRGRPAGERAADRDRRSRRRGRVSVADAGAVADHRSARPLPPVPTLTPRG